MKVLLIIFLGFLTVSCSSKEDVYILEDYTLDTIYTKEEAIEDLDFALEKLYEYHPGFDKEKVEKVHNKFEEEKLGFGEEVSKFDIIKSISKSYSLLKDMHTGVSFPINEYYVLPYTFDYHNNKLTFNNGNYIVKSIGGISVKELYNNFKEIWFYDIEEGVYGSFEIYISLREYLALIGVDVKRGIEIKYTDLDGNEYSDSVYFEKFTNNKERTMYDYIINEEENYGVFLLNIFKVVESGEELEEYTTSIDNFFKEVKEKNITNVALDLRRNPGGAKNLRDYFLAYLGVKEYREGYFYLKTFYTENSYIEKDPRNVINNFYYKIDDYYEGDFYVFTSNHSLSQSSLTTDIIQKNDLGLVIGEIPGGGKNTYLAPKEMTTPNSEINLAIATGYQSSGEKDNSDNYVYPDIEVHEKDVLDTFINYINKN